MTERGMFMAAKKNKPIKLEELTQEEKMKYEIAEELGLLDRVMKDGWKSLSSKETGRIGGLMTKKKKAMNHDYCRQSESMSGCTLKVTKILRILISVNI